jgi:translation initiation factor 3 subunit C
VQLAELIENTSKDKDKVKKMSKTNAKSLNAMKQNIKKNNIQYEDEIKKYMEVKPKRCLSLRDLEVINFL